MRKVALHRHVCRSVDQEPYTERQERMTTNILRAEIRMCQDIDQHIKAYARPSCQALCEYMQRRLPRELRDIIFGYILDDLLEPKTTITEGTTKSLVDIGNSSIRLHPAYQCLVNEGYLDPTTTREFSELVHRKYRRSGCTTCLQ
jgi:hypothetical protein